MMYCLSLLSSLLIISRTRTVSHSHTHSCTHTHTHTHTHSQTPTHKLIHTRSHFLCEEPSMCMSPHMRTDTVEVGVSMHLIPEQPCHVVYTEYRPTPLQHFLFPAGGDGLYMVVDENHKFLVTSAIVYSLSVTPFRKRISIRLYLFCQLGKNSSRVDATDEDSRQEAVQIAIKL